MTSVRKMGKEMMDGSEEDTSNLQSDLIELTTNWDRVCKLSVEKQKRLDGAMTMVRIDCNFQKMQGMVLKKRMRCAYILSMNIYFRCLISMEPLLEKI